MMTTELKGEIIIKSTKLDPEEWIRIEQHTKGKRQHYRLFSAKGYDSFEGYEIYWSITHAIKEARSIVKNSEIDRELED